MFLTAALLIFAAEPLTVLSATPDETRNKLFARTEGWIGADGDYSVTLPNGTTLWFFSDTWLGKIENGKRRNAKMINNSVGVMAGGKVDYHWGGTAAKPAAWLTPEDGVGWFWPFAGVATNGTVQLVLMQMEKAAGPEAFGFKNTAAWLATIENPTEAMKDWKVKQEKIPHTRLDKDVRLLFGAAMMVWDGFTYVYGTLEKPKVKGFGRKLVVARTTKLADFKSWRFFTGTEWSEDLAKLDDTGPEVAAEYSVMRFRDGVMLVTQEAMLGPRIIARTAEKPWGTWSKAVELYRCPEAGKGVFCYSGKAHAGLSNKDEITLTYAANAFKLADVLNDAELYWPKFVTVKLKPSK